ncbi:MAG: hypothetical protein QG626_429 [Patescibacteria group bacterium]|jgi:hypothetical protein|nr:hypothetical protein [Patescibacteria group bacterium]
MVNESILSKYKTIPIGKNNLDRDIFIERIDNESELKFFLYSVYGPRDESLTRAGLDFIKEFYGLDKVANIILDEKKHGVDYHFTDKKEIIEWLHKIAI